MDANYTQDVTPQAVAPLVAVVVLLGGATVLARRRGYHVGGWTIVRCSQGHLFSTLWVPGASFKAVRLGMQRLQRCPVGRHWTLVTPVRDDELTDEQRRAAERYRDTPVP